MRRADAGALLLAAAAALAVYCNALPASFQFDDYNVIVHNPAVHSLAAWLDSMPGIRPLLKLSYTLNWVVSPTPFGFHLANILIHAGNAMLVFLLLRRLRPGPDLMVPLIGGLLFALHPANGEAVAYVSGRSVSLMALFYLASLVAWLHADAAGSPGKWRSASVGLFAAALMTRETAVTLPLALLLLEKIRDADRPVAGLLRRHLPHWLLLLGGLAAMAALPAYRYLLATSLAARSVIDNLLTQANAVFHLAGQLVMPWRLNADPDLPVLSGLTPLLAAQVLVLMALAVFALRSLRARPWIAFAILWFVLHLLPTNSLLPRLDVANDRQLYLASIGVFAAAGAGMRWLVERTGRRRLMAALAVLLLLALGAGTLQRNQVYRSEIAFWEDVAEKSPGKPRAFNNLGHAYQQAGRHEEARRAYRRAIALDPEYWKAYINLSTLPPVEGSE